MQGTSAGDNRPIRHEESASAPTSPFRVLIYSRVSSSSQAQHGQSIEAQPEALKFYATALGWTVVGEVSDPGKTGRTSDREGFQMLMSALKHHRPDAVLVTRLSRFMRNARLTLNAVHDMRELGVALICKDEPIDTRQRGLADLFLAILATMAEWESDRLSEYAKETRQRLISKGRLPSGRPPYGYVYDKESGTLVPDEKKAEVVRLIFKLYTSGRLGMHAIRRELAARAISSPGGNKTWNSNTINKILSDSTYVGRHKLGVKAIAILDKIDLAAPSQREEFSSVYVAPGWRQREDSAGNLILNRARNASDGSPQATSHRK